MGSNESTIRYYYRIGRYDGGSKYYWLTKMIYTMEFRELTKKAYEYIVEMEKCILSRDYNKGLKGHHYPTITKGENPAAELSEIFNIPESKIILTKSSDLVHQI